MKRTVRIGLLTSSLKSPFVDRAVSGLAEVLAEEEAELEAFEMHGLQDLDYHRYIEDVASHPGLDGLIVCHLRLSISQILRFKERGLPILGLTERMEGLHWATVDEMKAAYLATRHLLSLGHRQIAMVNGPLITLQARLREDGFLRALADDGLKPGRDHGIHLLNFAEEEGAEAGHMLLDLPHAPTAVFVAAGDLAARGLMQAVTSRGKSVPRDLSVVGFDGLRFSETLGLTTVDQPLETMGRWAARRMLDAIKAEGKLVPSGELFEPELIIRKSTGVPASSVPRTLSKTGG
jgi:LacI family transcriptional regulator